MRPVTRDLLSVGIDVGTTTTQVVFSRLTVAGAPPGRGLSGGSRPEGEPAGIVARAVIAAGEPHLTPLAGPDEVDAAALEQIVRQEYGRAGIDPAQVETGAVIITGETAKKRNADKILAALSTLAGDFVVAVAGPHLEGLLAGRGSGAAAYSRQHFTRVTNVDIGGGSANSAVFDQGELAAAAAMNCGGRILQLEPGSGRIQAIARPAQVVIDALGLPFRVGEQPGLAELRTFTNCLAGLTVELIEGVPTPLGTRLMLTPPSPVSARGSPLFFSGGVGYYFYRPAALHSVAEVAVHGDIGPLLAESLRRHPALQGYAVRRPPETLRATVMGASSQAIAVSGSTIWAEPETLPLKNVPVLWPRWPAVPPSRQQVTGAVREAAGHGQGDADAAGSPFALALELAWPLDYGRLAELAAGLADFAAALPAGQPLLIVMPHDYGRALGQVLKSLLPGRPLLVIDEVRLQPGDMIDIGRPILDGRVVPLSVKTLIFYHEDPSAR